MISSRGSNTYAVGLHLDLNVEGGTQPVWPGQEVWHNPGEESNFKRSEK